MKDTTVEPINLDHFEDEFFREAIRRHVEEYAAHFDDRLVAIYVSGSVHRNEAVPGLSDLDLHPFISDTFGETDWQWKRQVEKQLDLEFGAACGLCPARPFTEEFLAALHAPSSDRYTLAFDPADGTLRWQPEPGERKAKLAREYGLLLRYDATLVWGRNRIEGLPIPPSDRTWALVWFLSPWELTRYAAGVTRENRTDFDLPEDPRLRLHELAKLAKLGGAALLMARGEFRSFRYAEIFPALKQLFTGRAFEKPPLALGAQPALNPRRRVSYVQSLISMGRHCQWASFLDESTESYFPAADPAPDQLSAYLSRLLAWMDWIGAQLYGDAAVRRGT